MTFPPGAHSSPGRPPLDNAASAVIAAARARLDQRTPIPALPAAKPPVPLTAEQRAEALDVIKDGGACTLCGGLHQGADLPACPRLATFRLDGDGRVVEGSFWPGTEWAAGRVVLAEDAAEPVEGVGDGST